VFMSYDMDRENIEGGNLEIIWPDELVPPDWVETMELRIAEKDGWMVVTFTPVAGYTETVRMFQDGATTCKESTAFLCPKDGGPPDVARALGLSEAELVEVQRASEEKRAAAAPQSRPEDCNAWLEGKSGQMEVPAGREFDTVPRVMKSVDPEENRAVVFFHSSDNPYGNPKSVWSMIAKKHRAFIAERWYGLAHKTFSARFPRFDAKVHVVKPEEVPAVGSNYHFVDPCSGRNFFMGWFRATPEGVYMYREWPGNSYIDGVGVPGPWALPDGKKPDGRPGPGQNSFGFGNVRYKKEIAMLEGWEDAKPTGVGANVLEGGLEEGEFERVKQWSEANGARERIETRYIDSRFASTPRLDNDRPKTLLTDFEDIGLLFEPTVAGEERESINEGVQMINDALDYNAEKPVDFFNKPKFFVSADCVNTIYALQTWTGRTQEGKTNMDGATKDPIDVVRYFFLSAVGYVGGKESRSEPGGHY
jgi:phage terminase large subunit-like protein